MSSYIHHMCHAFKNRMSIIVEYKHNVWHKSLRSFYWSIKSRHIVWVPLLFNWALWLKTGYTNLLCKFGMHEYMLGTQLDSWGYYMKSLKQKWQLLYLIKLIIYKNRLILLPATDTWICKIQSSYPRYTSTKILGWIV